MVFINYSDEMVRNDIAKPLKVNCTTTQTTYKQELMDYQKEHATTIQITYHILKFVYVKW